MPYGMNTTMRSDGNVLQYWYDGAAPGVSVNPYTVAGRYYKHAVRSYSRTGTNASSKPLKNSAVKRLPDGPLEWRLVTVPGGKRLAYKTYSKRLKKFVWARGPVKVLRLVRTYKSKPPKNKKGMNLPPNALNFESSTCSYFGENLTIIANKGGSSATRQEIVMQGALWAPFLPFGATFVGGVNADTYAFRGISSRFAPFVTVANNACTARLYERVKAQSVNLAQALVEYRQTAKLFYDLVKRLFQFWFKLKSGNLVSAMRQLLPTTGKQLSNDHLAIQYGVKPLLSDLEGVVKTLTERPSVEFDVIVRQRVEVPRALIGQASGPSGKIRFADYVYSFGYVEVKYKYRFRISSPTQALDRTLSQLGFGNLNSLAWETIPFSFVVDWFLPIGNFLNNADAFSGLTVLSSTKTVFQKEYIEFSRTFGGAPVSGFTTSSGTCGFINENVSCVRSLTTAPPTLRFPEFKDPTSKMHIANALALIYQLRK